MKNQGRFISRVAILGPRTPRRLRRLGRGQAVGRQTGGRETAGVRAEARDPGPPGHGRQRVPGLARPRRGGRRAFR